MNHSLVLVVGPSLVLALSCNPVRSDAIAALGDEQPGVRTGPTHRPGQPCLLCHDGSLGSPEGFSVAGTVFERPEGDVGANGVTVELVDSTGAKYSTVTNSAGNFYVQSSRWQPHYPMMTTITSSSGQTIPMQTLIGWSGACATCHTSMGGPESAGPVALQLDDGGLPP